MGRSPAWTSAANVFPQFGWKVLPLPHRDGGEISLPQKSGKSQAWAPKGPQPALNWWLFSSLCATIIPSQIQAWYLCRDLHIPEIALYFKSERCYKLPFSYSVLSGFFNPKGGLLFSSLRICADWRGSYKRYMCKKYVYSELVLKAGDLSAVISRVFHEQAKSFRLSNQQ